jgi:hypothetical protein
MLALLFTIFFFELLSYIDMKLEFYVTLVLYELS